MVENFVLIRSRHESGRFHGLFAYPDSELRMRFADKDQINFLHETRLCGDIFPFTFVKKIPLPDASAQKVL